jgi:hypothetical protein
LEYVDTIQLNTNEFCFVFGNKHVLLTFYTGCPSLAELSKIWPYLVDANSSNAAWESPIVL